MRRFAGPILVGIGAFLLLGALLVKFYAYPKLAIAPIDQNSTTALEAKDATIFDIGTLKEIQTDLSIKATTRGDEKATEDAGGDTRVWAGTTTIRKDDGSIVSQSAEKVAFDGVSAEAKNCCGAFDESTAGERETVKRSGLVFKFPFDTEKKTYKVWDDSTQTAVDAKFVKEHEIKGLKVYQFKQEVPRTMTGTRDVPGDVVGETGATVTADEYYQNTRTFEIEPVTGAVVNRIEEQLVTLAIDGEDRATLTDATVQYTDKQVKEGVDDYSSKATLLSGVHGLYPLLMAILGLLAVGAGVLLHTRGAAGSRKVED